MASEFVYALAAGLVVLIAGGFLAGYSDFQPQQPSGPDGDHVFSESIGLVGEAEPTSRLIDLGDVEVQQVSPNTTAVERSQVAVRSKLFGRTAETMTFEATDPREAYVSFVPQKMGNPGQLVVRVNGERVAMPDFSVGEPVTVSSETVEEGLNSVTVTVEDQGLAFWRTPSFNLQEFAVVVDDRSREQIYKPFRVYDYEIQGFDRGKVSFFITRDDTLRDGPLTVRVNGDTVMKRTPISRPRPYETEFFANTTDLTAGENVLTVSTAGNAFYPLEDLRLRLSFLADTEERTVNRAFNLSSSEYSSLEDGGGTVVIDVDRMVLQRDVTVSIPNREFTRTLSAGENVFSFGQDAVNEGENQLSISTDGTYRINELRVSVE